MLIEGEVQSHGHHNRDWKTLEQGGLLFPLPHCVYSCLIEQGDGTNDLQLDDIPLGINDGIQDHLTLDASLYGCLRIERGDVFDLFWGATSPPTRMGSWARIKGGAFGPSRSDASSATEVVS